MSNNHFLGVRYQYFAAPATPTKSSSPAITSMGSIGFMTSGATLYNPLSGPDGSLASYYEWSTLDPCYGHSSVDKQYHYHAVNIQIIEDFNFYKHLIIEYFTTV